MKYIKNAFTLFCIFFTFISAQTNTEILNDFAAGNITKLYEHFNNNIEISIFDADNVYNKSQTKNVLSDFFKKHHPSNFTLTHKTENEKTKLYIGKLYTETGSYKILILTKKNSNKDFIHQIRIEEFP